MRVSVCIPTLNANGTWVPFSRALKAQNPAISEAIVIDSESEDGTAELAKKDGFRVVQIPRSAFNHGATRRYAAKLAKDADILVYLTQDAVLANPEALAELVKPFEDSAVAASYGRQLPRKGAGPIEAHARLFNYPAISGSRSLDSAYSLGFKTIFFSNSFGAYRRSALESIGWFSDSEFGEDTVAVAKLLLRGWTVSYSSHAQAYHSHGYSAFQEFLRSIEIGRLHSRERLLMEYFGCASGEGKRFVQSELKFLLRAAPWLIPKSVMRTGFKCLGYKVGRLSFGEAAEPHSQTNPATPESV
jgi:rhamnosyltransferase